MATRPPWEKFALIAIALAVLFLVIKLVISVIWTLFVLAIVVGVGVYVAGRLEKR